MIGEWFINAVKFGDIDTMKMIADSNIDINNIEQDAFMTSIIFHSVKSIKFLLKWRTKK